MHSGSVKSNINGIISFWDKKVDDMPVFGSIAAQFNDPGVNALFNELRSRLFPNSVENELITDESHKKYIIPPARVRYLSEITETIARYDAEVEAQSELARQLFSIQNTIAVLEKKEIENANAIQLLEQTIADIEDGLQKKIDEY